MLTIFVALLCIIIIGLITYARWNYGKLEKLGIPVVSRTFIFGSTPNLHLKVQHEEDLKRLYQYGSIWGVYQGRKPIVYICDPDLIKQIFIKDNDHFFDRDSIEFGDPIMNQILDLLPGETWKTMRVAQTKSFTSSKIKQTSSEIFTPCVIDFLNRVKRDLNGENRLKVDARSRFHQFTIDVISRCAFSMKIENPDDPNNKFFQAWTAFAGADHSYTWLYTLSLVFPILAPLVPTFNFDHKNILETFRKIMKERKPGEKFNDFGDIISECSQNLGTPEYNRLNITEITLQAQAVNLFLAAFDRISSIMTFLAYHLSLDPIVEEKFYQELDSIIDDQFEGRIDTETTSQLPYITACITETLRMYPILIRPERVCTKDWSFPDKEIKITKGIAVMIACYASNRHPDFYDEPNKFCPERFLPDNKSKLHPQAFSSFGHGHRNCIGMRFAYECLKIGVCHIFRQYKFQRRDDTQLKFKPGVLILLQFDPLYLDMVKRK